MRGQIGRRIRAARPNLRFEVASNPEFLREGAAIEDFKRPDRIVVGSDDEWAREVLSEIYRPLFLNRAPILFTSRRSAELITAKPARSMALPTAASWMMTSRQSASVSIASITAVCNDVLPNCPRRWTSSP